MFGPNAVLFMPNDRKASIPLGLAAANLQVPLLIHIEYKVKLLIHGFAIGPQHKLIPSVYGICQITNTGDVLYSGDTLVRIRSGNDDTWNAYAHAFDAPNMFQLKLVKQRPVEMDCAQDEAPCFPKILATAADQFRLLDLDVLLHGVNAVGLSAFNPVESRMALLSHDLAGIIFPYDHFGNYLDSPGKINYLSYISQKESLVCAIYPSLGDSHTPRRFTYNMKSDDIYKYTKVPSRDFRSLKIHVKRHFENKVHRKNDYDCQKKKNYKGKCEAREHTTGMPNARLCYADYLIGSSKKNFEL